MRIQTLPAPEAEPAYAGEGSLCARQAQENIFSDSEMLNIESLRGANIKSRSSTRAESRL